MSMLLFNVPLPLWLCATVLGFALTGSLLVCFTSIRAGAYAIRRLHKWLTTGFRVRCEQCQGTGMCLNPDGTLNCSPTRPPHSCCGDCDRVRALYSQVEPAYRYAISDRDPLTVMLGTGWVHGSLWARIRHGGPRKRLGVLPSKPRNPRPWADLYFVSVWMFGATFTFFAAPRVMIVPTNIAYYCMCAVMWWAPLGKASFLSKLFWLPIAIWHVIRGFRT